jgi:3-phosphoshikimate 1-carboxyvinyltransferase
LTINRDSESPISNSLISNHYSSFPKIIHLKSKMDMIIHPAPSLRGVLRVPGDRSITVRAVLLGALASGVSVVRGALDSEDTQAALNVMRALGVQIDSDGDMHTLRIHGVGLRGLHGAVEPLFCNSSGTTFRLLAGLLAGQTFASTLDGSAQLRRRPMRRITEPLGQMGTRITAANDCAPLSIQPAALHGIDYAMPIASAQVKSALLLAALYADGAVTIHEPAPTRDHTERMLAAMGADVAVHAESQTTTVRLGAAPASLRPLDMTVPADFSSAAFFLAAGVLPPAGVRVQVRLISVGLNPTRTGLLDALRAMGANIAIEQPGVQGGEPVGDLLPTPAPLHGIEVGGALTARMIDEFPIFAVLATQAHGTTVVRDAQELRVKESNRIDGLVDELRKMGASIEATPDGFVVQGPTRLRGAVVDTHADHRVAMALAVAGLIAHGDTTLLGAECVSKTYPTFFADLASLTGAQHE